MDNTVKNIKNLSLFGIIPIIFAIVFVGIYLERCKFNDKLFRNIFLVLLAVLAILAIIILYQHAPLPSNKEDKKIENFVAQPTCG